MCDCVIPDFYREERRRARKQHRCEECRAVISPGDIYASVSGKWDGEVSTYKMCLLCKMAHLEYERVSDCCVVIGDLAEELRQSCNPADWDTEHTPDIAAWIKAKKPEWLAAT